MSGAVITGAFVMAAVGRVLPAQPKSMSSRRRSSCDWASSPALIVSMLQVFPTGDAQGRMLARNQPATLAAMEALFETQTGAPLDIIGQPDVENQKIDNPMVVPKRAQLPDIPRWSAEVKGLERISRGRTGRRTFRCSITATTSWSAWGRSSSP